mmetsp:Transcript_75406/g.200071  ORF Transcript_75406/g.200071 Transcript_75406/m.200071 type:complete len:102 (-) Transcript_75406:4-309(-)
MDIAGHKMLEVLAVFWNLLGNGFLYLMPFILGSSVRGVQSTSSVWHCRADWLDLPPVMLQWSCNFDYSDRSHDTVACVFLGHRVSNHIATSWTQLGILEWE